MSSCLWAERPPLSQADGGITTVNDALEFIIAGASAVGIGTALFYDPMVCRTINEGIAANRPVGVS